jgi:hypothetical protein
MTPDAAHAELRTAAVVVRRLSTACLHDPDLIRICATVGIELTAPQRGVTERLRELDTGVATFPGRAEPRDLGPAVAVCVAPMQGLERWIAGVSAHLKGQPVRVDPETAKECRTAAGSLDRVLDELQTVRIAIAEIW